MWVTFLGAAACAGREGHTRFELFIKRLKPVPGIVVDITCSVLIMVVTVVFIFYGFKGLELISFERFVILGIPYTSGYAALPVGAILIFIYYCRHLYRKITRALQIAKSENGFEKGKSGNQ